MPLRNGLREYRQLDWLNGGENSALTPFSRKDFIFVLVYLSESCLSTETHPGLPLFTEGETSPSKTLRSEEDPASLQPAQQPSVRPSHMLNFHSKSWGEKWFQMVLNMCAIIVDCASLLLSRAGIVLGLL